ncbi:hypothetical protein GCM10010349_73010 [Streptomyces flavofungini]|nr:hypothetical protein GCM10010349_73010 [Streptomyces flavofungini]
MIHNAPPGTMDQYPGGSCRAAHSPGMTECAVFDPHVVVEKTNENQPTAAAGNAEVTAREVIRNREKTPNRVTG